MDTLVVTPTDFTINAQYMNYDGGMVISEGTNQFEVPANARVYFMSYVNGTRKINNASTAKYERIGFNFGGIEWSITAGVAIAPDADPVPIPLTPKTYIDAYGVLHLGPEVERDGVIILTVMAKLTSPNPSGSGYEIDSNSLEISLVPPTGFGNANDAERAPYIVYRPIDTPTPASGAGLGGEEVSG